MGSHQPIRKTVAPAPVAIPDKLYFRIGDVAKLCSVAPYVLRFWETEFPQLKPNKGGTGQRLYRKKDVEMALRIKTLLYEQGFTIAGARQILKGEPNAAAPAGEAAPPEFAPRPVLHKNSEAAEPIHAGATVSEAFDRGAELRLRAQLADLRDEIQALLAQLSQPVAGQSTGRVDTIVPAIASVPSPKPSRPRLVLEPKPTPRPAAQTATLHLAQGDLFSTE